ncbi:MAG TPA: HAMP domain-containing protein [Blastocatellia bacterium]|nr:HAMP domain-containing protein [Blastocatellia bacterium]
MRLNEKLAALLAVAAILPLLLFALLVIYSISSGATDDRSRKLQTDARVASAIYEKRLAEMRSAAQRLANDIANRAFVNAASADGDRGAVSKLILDMLAAAQQELSMDFLIVADPQGRVYVRHNNLPEQGETLVNAADKNLVAERVIAEAAQLRTSPVAACVVERGQRLARLGLDKRARVGDVEDALVIEAGAPIFGAGRFLGMVLIGQMLNNSHGAPPNATSLQLPLEEEIEQTLFRAVDKETGRPAGEGGVVIALGNRIVASSLPAGDRSGPTPGGALLGAACDTNAAEETLQEGNAAYTVAWQGVKSLDQSRVAALGVAVPANSPAGGLRTTLIVVSVVALAVAAAAGFFYGRSLSERLKTLSAAANRMGLGELSTPVKDPAADGFINRDEINGLAGEMDQMRESFRQAIDRMRKR